MGLIKLIFAMLLLSGITGHVTKVKALSDWINDLCMMYSGNVCL